MKITTKKPLRPRGRNSEKRQETKDSIAEVYTHGPAKPVQIIPATKETEEGATKKKLRVCAYCRVSTEEELRGLDLGEHGMEAYPGFQFFSNQ